MPYHEHNFPVRDPQRGKKRRGAALSAWVIIVLALLLLIPMLALLLFFPMDAKTLPLLFFLFVYIGLGVAVIWGVLTVLQERFEEIDCGEEEEAKKY